MHIGTISLDFVGTRWLQLTSPLTEAHLNDGIMTYCHSVYSK